jgi:hypothetical protein
VTVALFLALGVTIVVEGAIAVTLLRRNVWLDSTIIQCLTWPFAQLLLWRGLGFLPIEAGVAIVETVLWRVLANCSWPRALVVSLAANGVTALLARFVFNP